MFSRIGSIITTLITLLFIGGFLGSLAILYVVFHYSRDLPEYAQLAEYSPSTVTRLYAADGRMIKEYAKEKRIFVPINAIPKRLINAFIAAEDKNFYSHPGIDVVSIVRAAVKNVTNIGKNRSLVGGSTITQQVVKNFLLTNEKSFERKIKEAILAFRITQAFPKDKIMELYLNEIYLGNRSYGVAAAALNYFNKSIDELTIEEAAMLASLPKAPSSLDPRRFPEKAKARRNWVVGRMEEEGYIDEVESLLSIAQPIIVVDRDKTEIVQNASFFAEAVRQKLEKIYGEEGVYEEGLAVRTTIEPVLQNYAENALKKGLLQYDKRHGWRGPFAHIENISDLTPEELQIKLSELKKPGSFAKWELAVVTSLSNKAANITLASAEKGTISLKTLRWAKEYIDDNEMGDDITHPSGVLKIGDIVPVRPLRNQKADVVIKKYALEQLPQISGAIVAMDPHSGKILAMVGGYYYGDSQFNRAIQAKRQPGSAFKPFVYLAALENGFAPNSIIVDDEVQLEMGEEMPGWRPKNYSGKYYGSTTLRVGVEKSRNAMTVRLAQLMGISKVIEIAKRLDINPDPDRNFAVALGAAETNLVSLTNAYSMLVNGGKKIQPSMIERIQDRNGSTIYKRDNRICTTCLIGDIEETEELFENYPILEDNREQIINPIVAYQTTSILEGVVQRGTGRRLKSLNKVLAGKTGTTNDSIDAWFMGFSADLAIGVYVGFDTPKTLGKHETGASAALPIWKDFAKHALKNKPDIPFRRPAGVKLVKIDATTGKLPSPDTPTENIIFEAFKAGTEPTSSAINQPNDKSTNDIGEGEVY